MIYELKLFNELSIEIANNPKLLIKFIEFYPSYIRFGTPYIIQGELPIDLPWLYCWLTVLGKRFISSGFIILNLINAYPPKHIEIGIQLRGKSIDGSTIEVYRQLREKVSARIGKFWNTSVRNWQEKYKKIENYSKEILMNPYKVFPRKMELELIYFQEQLDNFFKNYLKNETIDQFYNKMMAEIDKNEEEYSNYDFYPYNLEDFIEENE